MTKDDIVSTHATASISEIKLEEKILHDKVTKKSQIKTNYYSYVILIASFVSL